MDKKIIESKKAFRRELLKSPLESFNKVNPAKVVLNIREALKSRFVAVSDAGYRAWIVTFFDFKDERIFLEAGDYGSMVFLSRSISVKLVKPEYSVISVAGDDASLMSLMKP